MKQTPELTWPAVTGGSVRATGEREKEREKKAIADATAAQQQEKRKKNRMQMINTLASREGKVTSRETHDGDGQSSYRRHQSFPERSCVSLHRQQLHEQLQHNLMIRQATIDLHRFAFRILGSSSGCRFPAAAQRLQRSRGEQRQQLASVRN